MKSKKTQSHTVSNNPTFENSANEAIATTLKAAAAMSGLSMTIVKVLKASGSLAFRANGRVDIAILKADAEKLPPMKTSGVDFYEEQALDKKVDRQLKEQKLAERAKLLIPIETVKREIFRNVIAFKTKIYQAEQTIQVEAGMKLSLTPDQQVRLREIIRSHHHRALLELHKGERGQVICPECQKEVKA